MSENIRRADLVSADPARLYRLLVENIREYAIFTLDPAGHIMTWNPGAEQLKGYAADDVIGAHFSVLYPQAERENGRPSRALEIARRDGRFHDEGWRQRKDGSRFWADVTITVLVDESGTLVGFAKVTRDLTKRHQAEGQLRAREQAFRLLVDNVRDHGLFTLDLDGTVTSWNAGAERISGYRADEILGKHFSVFYPAADVAADKPMRELEIVRRDGRFEEEGWRVRSDGGRYWSNVVITAIYGPEGELVGFGKVTRDLTERRAAAERALADERRLAAAEAANRTKTEFLRAMSHELRTPLNAIGGYTELLEMGIKGPVTGEQTDYLGRIRRAQQHLLGIINDILNFSRIEAGQIVYDIAGVELSGVIGDVVPMVQPQAEAKGLRLETRDGPHPTVQADRAKLEQILLNLLSNAVKFTTGGSIEVISFEDGDTAGIRVRDTGVGIPPDQLQSVFEPFVQVGRTLSSTHEGTGLGLAISRDLARAMGGQLLVESQPGVGSTFSVVLNKA